MINPSESEAHDLVVYATALQDLLRVVTGSSTCAKSYDPMTFDFERQCIYSYAFDLKRGGRHHDFSDFASIDELRALMLRDVAQYLQEKST